jgi:hypothetical protein
MLTPVFHPNIAPHAICIGEMPACAQTGHAELVEAPRLLDPSSVVGAWNAGPSTSSG